MIRKIHRILSLLHSGVGQLQNQYLQKTIPFTIITGGTAKHYKNHTQVQEELWEQHFLIWATPKRHKKAASSPPLPVQVLARRKEALIQSIYQTQTARGEQRITGLTVLLAPIRVTIFSPLCAKTAQRSPAQRCSPRHHKRNMIVNYCPLFFRVPQVFKYMESAGKCLHCVQIRESDFTHRLHIRRENELPKGNSSVF